MDKSSHCSWPNHFDKLEIPIIIPDVDILKKTPFTFLVAEINLVEDNGRREFGLWKNGCATG